MPRHLAALAVLAGVFTCLPLRVPAQTAPEKPRPTRPVTRDTAAWWTFDNHLRDEVAGLALVNPGNPDPDAEAAYGSPYGTEVPVREFGDQLNWRTYYRWLQPNLTAMALGRELDCPGAFTVEAYIRPRAYPDYPFQPRAYLLRKNRTGADRPAQPQWAIELRRRADSKRDRAFWADLWAMVALQMPDGAATTVEVTAPDAIRLESWCRWAVVWDGKALTAFVDGQRVAATPGPGDGAVPLPTAETSELLLSNNHLMADGRTAPPADQPTLSTSYGGQIDEVRLTRAALTPDRFLPAVRTYAGEPLPDPPPRTEYTSLACRHLDVLLAHGTDTYGPVHSPLIASTLDPQTLKIMALKPPAGLGMPRVYSDAYRSAIQGTNMTDLRDTLMALWAAAELTGERKYGDHADRALRFWLEHCRYPSGAWSEGEHGVWNFYTDAPDLRLMHEPGIHADFERLWAIAPEAVRTYIEYLHTALVFEKDGVWYHERHGDLSGKPETGEGCGFIRHTGLLARAFAFLYSKTHGPKHRQWACDMVDQAVKLRDPKTGFYPTQIWPLPGTVSHGSTQPPAAQGTQPFPAAVGILEASAWLDDPADVKRFREVAVDMAMVNLDAYGKWDGNAYTRPLGMWVGDGVGWSILKFYELAGRPAKVLGLLRLSAQAAMTDWRPTTVSSSGELGRRILFFLQMHGETGEQAYLDQARRTGDYAAANLIAPNGLILVSGCYRYYDQEQNVDLLAQAFLALDQPRHPAVQRLLRVTK